MVSRRKFLKRTGKGVAVTGVTAALGGVASVPVKAAPLPLEEMPAAVLISPVPLCLGCELQPARYPKAQPRFCAMCRVISWRPMVREGLIDPDPRERMLRGLPQLDGSYVYEGLEYDSAEVAAEKADRIRAERIRRETGSVWREDYPFGHPPIDL